MSNYCRECEYPEPAWRDGLCAAHYKRRQRGRTVSGEVKQVESGIGRLREAAIRYSDASDTDDSEYARADSNLAKSAVAYTLGLPQYRKLEQLTGIRLVGHHRARHRRRVTRFMQLELPIKGMEET